LVDFFSRDRSSFWQRLGRVGRVLGKTQTDIPSDAIAYLPPPAWEQSLTSLDCSGGRAALTQTLANIPCLDEPFLDAYWRSEAFLEIARPLLEIEELFGENLAGNELIPQLFATLQSTLGGNHTWDYYRHRMRVLRAAEQISQTSPKTLNSQWKYIKGGQAFVKKFLEVQHPEYLEDLKAGRTTLEEWEQEFQDYEDAATELKNFAEVWSASYAPLFQFRASLFESIPIRDPLSLLLDESEETYLDPIHLLRNYQFANKGEVIEITGRAKATYEVSFRLRYRGSCQEFANQKLNKLTAFPNCHIKRSQGGAIAPTPLLTELEKHLLPGVIICPLANASTVYQLHKNALCHTLSSLLVMIGKKSIGFLPGLAGILTMAMKSKQLRLPDDEPLIA
jgi:CRISPR-associated endonuclease/helicase Cas3